MPYEAERLIPVVGAEGTVLVEHGEESDSDYEVERILYFIRLQGSNKMVDRATEKSRVYHDNLDNIYQRKKQYEQGGRDKEKRLLKLTMLRKNKTFTCCPPTQIECPFSVVLQLLVPALLQKRRSEGEDEEEEEEDEIEEARVAEEREKKVLAERRCRFPRSSCPNSAMNPRKWTSSRNNNSSSNTINRRRKLAADDQGHGRHGALVNKAKFPAARRDKQLLAEPSKAKAVVFNRAKSLNMAKALATRSTPTKLVRWHMVRWHIKSKCHTDFHRIKALTNRSMSAKLVSWHMVRWHIKSKCHTDFHRIK
uniref:Uncharacterized protein n=1 Tax=Globodera pallida TaxID=36090 RepID=A0A183CBD8_GLOPA